ncbi:AMP-binding protein [Streptomyces ferrugineus]|uniref:AMP-binding protein n=1 Tax=Streptomyces ferrugineus TaxID=1413221 RepID=A0A7M2SEV9_9ACTN|nr:AMP-binding protein [Streptomyces ferrugineus]QOV34285.1 AMP-binding protein [Streptomyces ferrugineus]
MTYRAETLTYGKLAQRVERAANGLRALGLRPLLAVPAAGAVLVPVNPALKAGQLAHIVEDCEARVVITTAERRCTVGEALGHGSTVGHVVLVNASGEDRSADVPWRVVPWDRRSPVRR